MLAYNHGTIHLVSHVFAQMRRKTAQGKLKTLGNLLDPLCGTGTILTERAQLLAYQELTGGDIRPEAVAIARRNARAAGVSISVQEWDARSLPLDAASVTRIITNLPFGKQIGSPEANEQLYPALVNQFGRVLAPAGILVALTSDDRRFQTVLQQDGWHIGKKVVAVVLGQPATIFVAERQ